MNNELKPYGEYKDSKVEWIGSIPSHWQVRKNSIIFTEIVDTNHPTLELLSILCTKGIVKQNSTERKIRMSEDNKAYKKICVGDIGYNLMNAFMGGIGASKYEGIISPAYAVCRPKIMLNSWYYHYLFRTPLYQSEFNKNSYGIMYERNRLYFDRFKRILSFIPPIEEQNQIVKYLDFQLFKINKFIKAKKKLIAVLKEQKQAVINEAVTKGINPDVKMKPSGIEWLEDIPEHWKVRPLKKIVKSNTETLNENYNKESVIRYIDIGSVGYGQLKANPVEYKYKDAPSRARRVVHLGDTIISTVRTYLKSMCYIDEEIEDCIVSTGFAVLTPNKEEIYPKILNYILSSYSFVNRVSKNSVGASYPAINENVLVSLKIVISNDINEQKDILNYIEEKTKVIDKSIYEIEKEISLISEYKIRLISDVVTGKVDVRNIVIDEEITEETELEEEIAEEEAIEVSSEEDNFDN